MRRGRARQGEDEVRISGERRAGREQEDRRAERTSGERRERRTSAERPAASDEEAWRGGEPAAAQQRRRDENT